MNSIGIYCLGYGNAVLDIFNGKTDKASAFHVTLYVRAHFSMTPALRVSVPNTKFSQRLEYSTRK